MKNRVHLKKFSFVNMKCSFLYCSCRLISVDNDTTPIYGNENIPNNDETEMYTGLDFKEDRYAYQALTRAILIFDIKIAPNIAYIMRF